MLVVVVVGNTIENRHKEMSMLTKVGLVMTAALAGSVAMAQPPRDTDGDGRISREEFMRLSEERFLRLDANADGYLSQDELRAMRNSMRGGTRGTEMFRGLDTDGDGALSLAELQARRPEMSAERFNELDRNGDGLLTPDEGPMRGPRF
jgi:Ca2+-binding EF-hand superfamily protein